MKKLLVLFIAITFFASFALVGCGPSQEKPPAAKEEAKTTTEQKSTTTTTTPAPAPEKK